MSERRSFDENFWPTFIEAWPPEVRAFAIPAREVSLDARDMRAILSATPQVAAGLQIDRIQPISSELREKIADSIAAIGSTVFPRLGGCSWKSHLDPRPFASDLQRMIRIIRTPNQRVATMLRAHLLTGRSANLYLRPCIDLPRWSETRAFVQNGRIIGASQYSASEAIASADGASAHAVRLGSFLHELLPHLHIQTVVVDIGLDAGRGEYLLIDLNPFDPRSGSCLFSWEQDDFDGSFRFVGSKGLEAIPKTEWLPVG